MRQPMAQFFCRDKLFLEACQRCSSLCAAYEADDKTGEVIYGYVSDSCPDDNWWCKTDTYHLDISKKYLESEGLASNWNGRKISWKYLSATPEGCDSAEFV